MRLEGLVQMGERPSLKVSVEYVLLCVVCCRMSDLEMSPGPQLGNQLVENREARPGSGRPGTPCPHYPKVMNALVVLSRESPTLYI
eukprot:998580-Prorocentrum_minimum.AAC.1